MERLFDQSLQIFVHRLRLDDPKKYVVRWLGCGFWCWILVLRLPLEPLFWMVHKKGDPTWKNNQVKTCGFLKLSWSDHVVDTSCFAVVVSLQYESELIIRDILRRYLATGLQQSNSLRLAGGWSWVLASDWFHPRLLHEGKVAAELSFCDLGCYIWLSSEISGGESKPGHPQVPAAPRYFTRVFPGFICLRPSALHQPWFNDFPSCDLHEVYLHIPMGW